MMLRSAFSALLLLPASLPACDPPPQTPRQRTSAAWLHAGVVLVAQSVRTANERCASQGETLVGENRLDEAKKLVHMCGTESRRAGALLRAAESAIDGALDVSNDRIVCASLASLECLGHVREALGPQALPREVDHGFEVARALAKLVSDPRCP